MKGWLIFIGVIGVIWFLVWLNSRLSDLQDKAKKYVQSKPILDNLDSHRRKLELKESELENKHIKRVKELESKESQLKDRAAAIEILVKEKTTGFPWLGKVYDDYFRLHDSKLAAHLVYKAHPARKAAEQLRQIAKERREAEKAARNADYLLDYCRFLAPWLDEYIGVEVEELDEIIKEIHSSWEKKERDFDEEVKRHFGPKYEGLTPTEKLQKNWIGIGGNLINLIGRLEGIMRGILDTYMRKKTGMFIIMERRAMKTWGGT